MIIERMPVISRSERDILHGNPAVGICGQKLPVCIRKCLLCTVLSSFHTEEYRRRTGKEQGRKCDCPAEHAAGQVDVTAGREGFRPYGPRMQRAMQLRTEAPQRRRPIFFQAHGAPWQSQRRRACTAA